MFDWTVQILILLSLITFSVEILPDLEADTRKLLDITELVITLLFTLEYLLRLYTAKSRLSYALSFYGLIDLMAVIPFYITAGTDLRSLKIFRMLRLLRLMKPFRYGKATHRFSRTLIIAKDEIALFSVTTAMLLYLASVGIYYFENAAQPDAFKSIFDSLWWAVATLTTVGYGGIYPITVGGKLFSFSY